MSYSKIKMQEYTEKRRENAEKKKQELERRGLVTKDNYELVVGMNSNAVRI